MAVNAIRELLDLIEKQRDFLVHDCCENDCRYQDMAVDGTLVRSRARFPRRGWTRQDKNRASLEIAMSEIDWGNPPRLPSVMSDVPGVTGNHFSTRVRTALRIFPIRSSVRLASRKALELCNTHPAFTPSDREIVERATANHLKWLTAFGQYDEHDPQADVSLPDYEFEEECTSSRKDLKELAKSVDAMINDPAANGDDGPVTTKTGMVLNNQSDLLAEYSRLRREDGCNSIIERISALGERVFVHFNVFALKDKDKKRKAKINAWQSKLRRKAQRQKIKQK